MKSGKTKFYFMKLAFTLYMNLDFSAHGDSSQLSFKESFNFAVFFLTSFKNLRGGQE